MASGDVRLNADFGFQGSGGGTITYSISDRVWFDTNPENGLVDGGESGLGGVTVNLLDASLNIIATTTTAADGSFSFSGVANGNYTIDITDTGNVLVDYYGTTTAAISGSKAVTVSSGNVAGTSFGYNVTRSIGDTVFNDIGGVVGTQDPGEPGISGVLVELVSSGRTQGTNCPNVTTDANGMYLFSGLSAGVVYTVVIPSSQAALTEFTQTTTAPAPITLSGGDNNLDADFGFSATGTKSVFGGVIWNDKNQDGNIDSGSGENGIENVIVELIDSGGAVVQTVSTAADGSYAFNGYPGNKTYTVRVTDSNSA